MAYKLSRRQAVECIKKIRRAIQAYFSENNLTYAVFGKSEGLDSSVIAGLLSNLKGIKPVGVIMPCESNPEAEQIARLVLAHFKIPVIHVDLTHDYHALLARYYSAGAVSDQLIKIMQNYKDHDSIANLIHSKSRAVGNIKVRLRMITLYHIAQLTGGLVVSTDNLSELMMGFWTINGDVGDFSPIQYIWKGLELYTIAKELGVPEESLNVAPTDGLDIIPGGTDEDQLGLPYHELDRVMVRLLQNRFNDQKTKDRKIKNQKIKKVTTENEVMFACIAEETKNSARSVAHVAGQYVNTHFKRNWPYVVKRKDLGLPDIDDMDVL